ncbi:MAG: hypothetical protein ACRCSS_08810 [Shewanella sp.]
MLHGCASRLGLLLVLTIFAAGCHKAKVLPADKVEDPALCQFNQGACSKTVGENTISLVLTPEAAPSEKPLNFRLSFSSPVQNLQGRLEGRDMFMGVIPVKWSQSSENQFQATAVYGSCASGYMIWRLWISFTDTDGKNHETWFDFKADNQD